ncbi:MAG TPA: TQO small subunit DoxD [Gemmatimonadales bacterium]|nr:TQO small subunit DoxD [Gemmatimonadales bacterium]
MDSRARPVGMERPALWLALLRVAVGYWFVKSLWTKLTLVTLGGVLPLPAASERWITTMPQIVARQAAELPIPWYKRFLEGTVIPNAELFAHLTALGETAVGLGLVLGLFTGLSSLVGLMLVIAYGLATWHMTPAQQGLHFVLFFCMLVFFLARAGRSWGIDAWIAARRPKSVLARRPIS